MRTSVDTHFAHVLHIAAGLCVHFRCSSWEMVLVLLPVLAGEVEFSTDLAWVSGIERGGGLAKNESTGTEERA
jgi:hypothetical protein